MTGVGAERTNPARSPIERVIECVPGSSVPLFAVTLSVSTWFVPVAFTCVGGVVLTNASTTWDRLLRRRTALLRLAQRAPAGARTCGGPAIAGPPLPTLSSETAYGSFVALQEAPHTSAR